MPPLAMWLRSPSMCKALTLANGRTWHEAVEQNSELKALVYHECRFDATDEGKKKKQEL